MKIEKINDNKLKIVFNSNELEENNISLHSFLSNSLESQKLFLAILDIANEDLGFDISNSKISYETYSFGNKTFVIFVTKACTSQNLQYLSEFDFSSNNNIPSFSREINTYSNSSFNFIGNNLSNTEDFKIKQNLDKLLYIFDNIEDVFSFCKFIYNSIHIDNLENSLYQYKNLFFIEFDLKNLDIKKQTHIYNIISEFKNDFKISELTFTHLKEFSNMIIKDNAIRKLQ